MLLRMLRSLRRRPGAPASDEAGQLREAVRLANLAANAPLERHLEILFREVRVAGLPIDALVREALVATGASVPPAKLIHRRTASLFLAQYFLDALARPGRRAECGVYLGTSARILCRAAQARDLAFDGSGVHLIDSFEGLSERGARDGIGGLGSPEMPRITEAGALAAPVEAVRTAFRDFPGVSIHQGWIPQVLAELPEDRWSFVHVDVDLYAPTEGALEYFWPRLVPGGVIVCDDYGSALFPGARRAWDAFCEPRGLPFVVLPTGQSVLIKS